MEVGIVNFMEYWIVLGITTLMVSSTTVAHVQASPTPIVRYQGGMLAASTIGDFAGTANLTAATHANGVIVDDVTGTLSGSSKPGFGGGAFSQ